MTTFPLGSRVSLLGDIPRADDYFMVVSEKTNADGNLFVVYTFNNVLKTQEAKPSRMRLETVPYKWVRGTEPHIGAVGFYKGDKVIVIDINRKGDGFPYTTYVVKDVSDGTLLTSLPIELLHPDEVNGILTLGQRVLVKGKDGVCYVVKHNGGDQYSVAIPPGSGEDKGSIINVSLDNLTPMTPAFNPGTGFGCVRKVNEEVVMLMSRPYNDEYVDFNSIAPRYRVVTQVVNADGFERSIEDKLV